MSQTHDDMFSNDGGFALENAPLQPVPSAYPPAASVQPAIPPRVAPTLSPHAPTALGLDPQRFSLLRKDVNLGASSISGSGLTKPR
jgi:hypothetical protein